jgi:tRNA threonylcarbamoyladenosine biosynthesis protein TsaE
MTATLALTTGSAEETGAMAGVVAAQFVVGDVVLLSGDLGAGKTIFAQGVGRALGIDEPVTSPTFALVRHYEVAGEPGGIRVLLHADVYRLEHLGEVADLGLGQLVEDAGVALVEWGDAAEPVLGDGALRVRLEADPDDECRRRVNVSTAGPAWAGRWPRLAEALAPWSLGRDGVDR